MAAILQTSIPYDPLAPRRLPGIAPLDVADWLQRDDAFAGQMAERDRLIATRRADVLALDDTAHPAAVELLETVLSLTYPGMTGTVRRSDGVSVTLDRGDPLGTLGRLVQDDFCILEKRGAEHVLTGAVLCFPASWTLSEKFLRPLIAIHNPVDSYDANIAARVQRLFDGVQPGRPLWRSNALWYADPDLHHPRREADPRPEHQDEPLPYLRSERQCILRLPRTRAVVFSIHTYVVARDDVVSTADAGRARA